MASAVGAPTGRRLRGGCDVGSWGEGIQWWTGCPDSIARALWKNDAGRGTLCVPTMPFWESSGHFGVSRGLKFESYVERVALAGGLGWVYDKSIYTKRGNVGHSKRGGGRGRRPTICCGSRAIQQGAW